MEPVDTRSSAERDRLAQQHVPKRSDLQTIFDAAQVGMILLDANAQVAQVNDLVTQLVGKESSELLARGPGDGLLCVHAGETPGGCGHAAACPLCPIRNTIEQVLREGRPVRSVEATLRLLIAGEEQQFCFLVNASPLTLEGDQYVLLAMADVTASKGAEVELRRSETKFRTLYDSTSDAVMLLDETGFFDCNDATLRIFECTDKAEFCTKHPADVSPARQPCGIDSMTLANQRIATGMREGSHRFEWVHKRLRTGEEFAAEVLLSAMELDGRRVLQAVVRDITVRKLAERSLQESKDRFERVAKSVSDLIYEWDMATDEIEWLGDISTVLGYAQGTIPPTIDGWLALIHPEDREKIANTVERHRRSLVPIDVTYRIRHNDGEWRHWEDRGSAVVDAQGAPVRVIGACTDVTERERAEGALRESEQRFLNFLYSADDAILLIDAETFVDCNDATARMLEYSSRDECLMIHPSELSPPEQPDGRSSFEKAQEMMATAFEKGFHRFEWVHCKATGEAFPVEVSLTPITYQGRTLLHCLWRDLTERKRAEAERKQLHERLLESSRLAGMSEVATGVLHNVGNVLNSVNVSANVVLEKFGASKLDGLSRIAAMLDEHAADLAEFFSEDGNGKQLPAYLRTLEKHLADERGSLAEEAEGLMKSIEYIKEIVSMQQAHASVSGIKELIRLDELLESALKLNDASFVRHNVDVVRQYEDVPPLTSERHGLLQILVNLISNAWHALKSAAKDDRRLTLRLRRAGEEQVVVEVRDNGVGIGEEDLDRVFEHGFTTKPDGHGFGLHSSAITAKQLGGSLKAYSDGPGRGACFRLELPVAVEEEILCPA